MPLVFFGAYTGFRKERMELPVRTNQAVDMMLYMSIQRYT